MRDVINGAERIRGDVRSSYVRRGGCMWLPNIPEPIRVPGLWTGVNDWEHNDVLYDWATIVGEFFRGAPDGKSYKPAAMYLEFENNGGAAVSPPDVARDEGLAYYDTLTGSETQDYLRVPITAATLTSTDEDLFPRGNRNTFLAQTSGSEGVNGLPYSAASQSRLFGGALVATPDWDDPSQDLILSRFYWSDATKQMVKLIGSECGLEWRLTLN